MNESSATGIGYRLGRLSRRDVLRGAGLGLGGVAGGLLVGCGSDDRRQVDLSDESLPPEVTQLVIPANDGAICVGPLYVADMFFGAEGFTDIQHPVVPLLELPAAITAGRLVLYQDFGLSVLAALDDGHSFRLLSGIHSGCYDLFAREGVNSIHDLKGKRIGVPLGVSPAAGELRFMASLLAYVGAAEGYTMVSLPFEDIPALLKNGSIDAALATPPFGEPIRETNSGHLILDSATDRPWANYFCCNLIANDAFVRKNPIATKRALRAVLRATDFIAQQPEAAAHYLVDNKHTEDYERTLRTLRHLPYDVWRQYNPEDSLRSNALRLHEAGFIKKTPDQIAKFGDWRFLNQLKREMAYAPAFPVNRRAFALDCSVDTVPDGAGPWPG